MGYFLSLSKAWTESALSWSELALLVFGALLVAGLVGEYRTAEKSKWYKRFEMFVIIGVLGELLADGGIFLFTSHLEMLNALEVAALNKEAGQAHERANKLELASEQQRERAAKAEVELLALQERLKPRSLSQELRVRLIDTLRASPKKGRVLVTCVAGDLEGCRFSLELRACLEEAGWPLEPQGGMIGAFGSGIVIVVRDATNAPAHAGELQRAMASAGLSVNEQENPKMLGERVILFVGSKQ